MEEALQALRSSETIPPCKSAALISAHITTVRNLINQSEEKMARICFISTQTAFS